MLLLGMMFYNNLFSQETKDINNETCKKIEGRYEVYYNNTFLNFDVFKKNNILYIQQEFDSPDELHIVNIDSLKFKSIDNNQTFYSTFIENSNGIINKVLLKSEGFDLVAKRHIERNIDHTFSIEQLREDFTILLNIIEKDHVSMYDFTNKETFDSLFNAQYNKINKPMNIEEFYNIILPIIANLGCAHSWIYRPKGFLGGENMKLLPLDVSILNNRLYVLQNHNKNSRIKPGSEIKSIDGKPIKEILETLKANISADAFNESWRTLSLSNHFSYYYRIKYGEKKSFKVEYILPDKKKEKSETIDCIKKESIEDNEITKKRLSLSFTENKKIAFINIDDFIFYQDRIPFYTFIDSAFKEISKAQTKNVILDLRGNMGGDPIVASYLLSYIEKDPVKYFEESFQNLESLADYIPLKEENKFNGNLYTLIDGGCFSTTAHLLSILKYHKIGKLIGVEAGGTFETKDGSRIAYLKNSRIKFKISRQEFATAVSSFDRNKGILPDYEVIPTIEDLLNEKDVVMNFTLKLILK